MNPGTGVVIGTILLAMALPAAIFALPGNREVKNDPEPAPMSFVLQTAAQTRAAESPVNLTAGNLFHPLRGKAPDKEAQSAAEKVQPLQKGNFELTGIFQSGDVRGAIITFTLQSAAPKRKFLFKKGDSLPDGYTVGEIAADQTVLVRGSEKLVLPLRKKQEKKP